MVQTTRKVPDNVYLIINHNIYPIKNRVTTIGRKLNNDIVIQNDFISRRHAEIRFEDGKFFLYDLNYTSGSSVNNVRVTKSALMSGDLILLANIPLVFIDKGEKLLKSAEKTTRKSKK